MIIFLFSDIQFRLYIIDKISDSEKVLSFVSATATLKKDLARLIKI